MTILTFSDGERFDTSGAYRIEQRCDGLYVVGEGMLCACGSREEAEELIRDLTGLLHRDGGAR